MSYEGTNFFDAGALRFSVSAPGEPLNPTLYPKPFSERWGEEREFTIGEQNARWFRALFAHIASQGVRPVRVYIPEGRYYIGLPATQEVSSEQEADLLVPAHVTLVFGPKATLVPLAYTKRLIESRGLRDSDWMDARTRLPESELWRVRIEIQGLIEADLDKIFDPFCEDDRDTSGRSSTYVPSRRGGTVFFVRDDLRAVYPEWWGAVPKRGDDGVLSDAEVRRTTVAIQSCIDAVLHHRLTLPRGGGQALRPSTEVVFANDYVIDRPIRLGMTLARARTETGLPFTGDEYPFHRIGVSIRGLCGPATRRNGAALLQAAHNFQREEASPEVTPRYGDSYSLMIVRTFGPVSIDNVIFDAAGVAERCLTVMTFTSTHHHVFQGCTFKNALYAQLYIGGEMPDEMLSGPIVPVRSRYYSGGQDLGDMRVSRCHFDTGGGPGKQLLRPPYRKDRPVAGQWLHGVVYRAEPALGTEFFGCVFTGPATPMFLAIGGRLSFQRCFFKTYLLAVGNPRPSPAHRAEEVDLRWWNGTDLHLAAGLGEYLWNMGMGPVPDVNADVPFQPFYGTMLTARDVTSHSRQFLTTYPDIAEVSTGNSQSFASVTLIHLHHRNTFTDDPENRPAIYWGAPRVANCALILQSCVFDTPQPRRPGRRRGGANPRGQVFISRMDNDRDPSPVVLLSSRRSDGRPLLCSSVSVAPNVMQVPE